MGRAVLTSERRGAVAVTAGFSCLYAVAIVFFYSDWLFRGQEASPLAYEALLNGCLCAAAALVILASRRFRVSESRLAAIGGCAYGLALVALVAFGVFRHVAFAYGAGAAAGVGAGVLVPLWFLRLFEASPGSCALPLAAGSLVGSVLALAVGALPVEAIAVAGALFVGCSLALLRRSASSEAVRLAALGKEDAESSPRRGGQAVVDDGAAADAPDNESAAADAAPEEGTFRDRFVSSVLYVAVFSVAYGMLDVVAMGDAAANAGLSGLASQVGGLAFVALFLWMALQGGGRFAALLNGALVAASTALLFLPFAPDPYRVILVVVVHGGWEVALLVLFTLALSDGSMDRRRVLAAAAVAFAAPRPGLVLGSLAAALLTGGALTFARITAVACVLLYLVVGATALMRRREKRLYRSALDRKDEIIRRYLEARQDFRKLACEQIAADCGLTAREAELLSLYAQGRDAAYIERTLYLSRNTVKSYGKALYAKLGVHSKQDLIELVDRAMEAQETAFYQGK